MEQISKIFFDLLQIPAVRVGFILAGSMVVALFARLVFFRLILSWSKKTRTDVDNRLADVLHGPVVYSIILAGIAFAIADLNFKPSVNFITLGIVKTLAVIIWGRAGLRIGAILLEALSRQVDRVSWIQPKTLPMFEIVMKVVVVVGAFYFAFIAWDINVTSLVASAGIVGIAFGFAAKDTLANLFAGVFILADTPYKIGDFIILEDVVRGQVTDIGIRSTRLLTRDDVEVTVPNSVIANSMVINETGGPDQKTRLRVKTSVAYGSDVDKVSELMRSCVKDVDHISAQPGPRVRFREFGDSGLLFELLVWVDKPLYKGLVLDRLNTLIYQKFNEEGIEIPYSKQDVYIKQMPKTTRRFPDQ